MASPRTYLDHNATSPLTPEAKAAMLAALAASGNASSVHAEGRAAFAILDEARERIATTLGVIPPMVIFTSGGSEANNLAIKGAPVERLVISGIEHPSIVESAKASGKPVEFIPVDRDGIVDLETPFVFVGNNVYGGCGFTFGNGCSDGASEVSLFGGSKKRTIPIKVEA